MIMSQQSDDNERMATVSYREREKCDRDYRQQLERVSRTKERPAERRDNGGRKPCGKLPEITEEKVQPWQQTDRIAKPVEHLVNELEVNERRSTGKKQQKQEARPHCLERPLRYLAVGGDSGVLKFHGVHSAANDACSVTGSARARLRSDKQHRGSRPRAQRAEFVVARGGVGIIGSFFSGI